MKLGEVYQLIYFRNRYMYFFDESSIHNNTHHFLIFLLNCEQNHKRSVATNDDSNIAASQQKDIVNLFLKNPTHNPAILPQPADNFLLDYRTKFFVSSIGTRIVFLSMSWN